LILPPITAPPTNGLSLLQDALQAHQKTPLELTELPNSLEHLATLVYEKAPPLKNTQRVLFFEGGSQYGAQNYYTQNLAQAFALRGHEVHSVNFAKTKDVGEEIRKILAEQSPTLLFSFNAVHEAVRILDNKTLGQHFNIPSISLYGDHPLFHLTRVIGLDYSSRIQLHGMVEGFNNIKDRLLPHGHKSYHRPILMNLGYPKFDSMKPYAEREHELLVPATFRPFTECVEELKFPNFPPLEKLALECAEYLIASPDHHADTMFLDGLEKIGINPREVDATNYIERYISIHKASEMYWREHMLRAAKNVPLRLFGNGWEKADFISDKWDVVPAPHMSELIEWYGNTKHIWNIFPLYPESCHDRISYGAANGANIITERKQWLTDNYADRLNYLPQELESVEDNLMDILNRPQAVQEAQARDLTLFSLSNRSILDFVLDLEKVLDEYVTRNHVIEKRQVGW
jgi:hypothetical protein